MENKDKKIPLITITIAYGETQHKTTTERLGSVDEALSSAYANMLELLKKQNV
jgi:hypothetical protein